MRTKWKLPKMDYVKAAEAELRDAKAFRRRFGNGKWKDDPGEMRKALDMLERMDRKHNWGFYLGLSRSIDMLNPRLKKIESITSRISDRASDELRFFLHGLRRLPPESQKRMLESAELSDYRHFLEKAFAFSSHSLDEEAERVAGRLSGPGYGNWVSMVSEFLSKETAKINGKAMTLAEISELCFHPSKSMRSKASRAFNAILEKHADEAEHELNSIMEYKRIMDELEKFERPDSSRHLSDDIETGMVDGLVSYVSSMFRISRKYYEMKAEKLGFERMNFSERGVPVGRLLEVGLNEMLSAVSSVLSGVKPEYGGLFREYLKNGQIDLLPGKGKSPGAFCSSNSPSDPVFVLMNFTGTARDVSTLSHEMGHAIHDELMKKQNSLNYGAPTPIAETASTFFETRSVEMLSGKSSSIIWQWMDGAVASVFRQIAAYRFELELHKKFRKSGYVQKEEISELFKKHMSSYMGHSVVQDMPYFWVYWSHFRYFFYNYSYPFGFLLSLGLLERFERDNSYIETIESMLSAGSSMSVSQLLKSHGLPAGRALWKPGMKRIRKSMEELDI